MPININRLLNKKGWTGAEVGKALLASLLHDIKNKGKEYKPLFTQSDFDKMESSINTEYDCMVYGVYRDIYSSVIDGINHGQGLYQQFYNGYSRLWSDFSEICRTEAAQQVMRDQYPLVMTAEQYGRLKEAARKQASGRKESFCSLVFNLLGNALEALHVDLPQTIADALEAARRTPAKNHLYIGIYNSTLGLGYYSLPDGRRSDKMTNEEWTAAYHEAYINEHKLVVDGKIADITATRNHVNLARITKGCELYFKGADAIRETYRDATGSEINGTDAELIKALCSVIDGTADSRNNQLAYRLACALGYGSPVTWHTYDTAPKNLTQFDLLEVYLREYRSDAPRAGFDPINDLKSDYPALYEAIAAYIEEHVQQAGGLKANNIHDSIVSWGDLERLGVMSYENVTAPTDADVLSLFAAENPTDGHCHSNSIAIIQNADRSRVDENGNYIGPASPLVEFQTLASVAADANKIAAIAAYQSNLINPALRYMYAFNIVMGILGAAYDVPELGAIAVVDTFTAEANMTAFNNSVYGAYYTACGSHEERDKKRKQIKAIFAPFAIDELKPTQEAIDAVTADVLKMGYTTAARETLKHLDGLVSRLSAGRGAV